MIRVYVVACGFGMMFYRVADIAFPFVLSLCSGPRDFQNLLLSTRYVKGHVLQLTLYTIPYNCSLVGRSSNSRSESDEG